MVFSWHLAALQVVIELHAIPTRNDQINTPRAIDKRADPTFVRSMKLPVGWNQAVNNDQLPKASKRWDYKY